VECYVTELDAKLPALAITNVTR